MPKIHIPTPLRQYAGKQPAVDVKGSTVAEALSGLISQHPDLRRHLYTEDGKLRAFVNVYLNDEDVRYLQKEATAVSDGDNISIVPSIAGGTGFSCQLLAFGRTEKKILTAENAEKNMLRAQRSSDIEIRRSDLFTRL